MLEMESGAGRQWSCVLVNWLLETVMSDCEGTRRPGWLVTGAGLAVTCNDRGAARPRDREAATVDRRRPSGALCTVSGGMQTRSLVRLPRSSPATIMTPRPDITK